MNRASAALVEVAVFFQERDVPDIFVSLAFIGNRVAWEVY